MDEFSDGESILKQKQKQNLNEKTREIRRKEGFIEKENETKSKTFPKKTVSIHLAIG